ncbi:hypothetical protein DRW03_06130 [Corallococcus sp. H22C18031201]|uniref:hypothetical protein n=1 Tax=Citreicoccus inhibens TaxID=2849499 RepID=UPI000E757A85|nr:hypothetical protein [Citreicoccus inhibens]MBU8896182.1 hypothetical protein [Citreicoccus inhibens]RJS26037.1 hypothetical protein DRW03_06130 [Corallococcus sp. H22C18031201]
MTLKSLLWLPCALAMVACGGSPVEEQTPAAPDESSGGQVSASCVDDCGEPEAYYCEPCPQGGKGIKYIQRNGCTCAAQSVTYEYCGLLSC